MRRSIKELLVEYGAVALVVHYTIGAMVIVGLYVAIRNGFEPQGAVQNAGMWATVYGAYKASMFVRVPITLFLVPFAAKLYERVTGRRPGPLPLAVVTPATPERSGPADAA